MLDNNFKIGDRVIWLDNPYTVIKITDKGVMLKQNFSIGVTLTQSINTEELKKE